MSYNSNIAKRTQEAKDDLAKKLILEQYLIKDLGPYYSKIKASAYLLYLTRNQVLDVSIFKTELKDILAKHYRRVSRVFGNLSERQLAQIVKDDAYTREINSYIAQRSQQQANYINKTDQNKLNDAFKAALVLWFLSGSRTPNSTVTVAPRSSLPQGTETHPVSGQSVSPQAGEGINSENLQIVHSHDILKSVSKSGIENFDAQLDSRKETIATTETQNSAETTKYLALAAYLLRQGLVANKQWITMHDDRVRPWHVDAEGQVKKDKQPFIVNGEELMYPGDTELGASLNNVINCRCSVHYYW